MENKTLLVLQYLVYKSRNCEPFALMVTGQFLTAQLKKISGKQTSKAQTYYHCCLCFVFLMPSWLLRHSTPHLWTRFSDEGFKTFLGGGYVTTLITGIFLSGIGKIFLFLRGKGGRLC